MAFTIPNEANAFNAKQAEPDQGDIDILVSGIGGAGVVSGCAVTAQATPDMTLAVASGTIRNADGTTATVSAGNVTITAADATNPRFDLVVVSSAGAKSVVAGTAATAPVYPAIPASSVVLAAVYVPAADTAIEANQITDKRVLLTALGSATPLVESGSGSAGTASAASHEDHVHPAATVSLTTSSGTLSSNAALTANTDTALFITGSLAVGTWLVSCSTEISNSGSTVGRAKIWLAVNTAVASFAGPTLAEADLPGVAGETNGLAFTTLITVTTAGTFLFYARSSVAATALGTGAALTGYTAVKIA